MHKICFDASTRFGWCLLIDDSHKPKEERRTLGQRLFYGTWDLTRDADGVKCDRRGQFYINLLESFRQLRRQHDIDDDQIEIVMEAEAYGAVRSEASARLAGGWLATLELLCERKAWLYPRTVTTTSWRKAFIGVTKAPKEITDSKQRREWIKAKVLEECARRGLKPQNDNEADALGLMFWLLTGGKSHQDATRAARKEKTLAKRRQQKLDLKVAA